MNNYSQDTKNIWFPTQKEPVYDPNDFVSTYQFKEYWKKEKERCIHGFYLADGQVFISGWLYAHTVYGKIAMYIENPKTGRKSRQILTPYLRDIEWIVATDFLECEKQGRFYDLQGSRDFGKSVIAASRAWWLYTFFDNSESVISGGADDYIKLATDKIEDFLTNAHPIWRKKRIASDWKREVKAGWKDKQSNQPSPNSSNSKILMRNYEMGNKTMAANGTRPGFHLIDETGTLPNLIGCVKDSDGCWWSGGGDKPSCLVMLAGTGGDMEKGAEAAEIFFNPHAYNILSFENWESGGWMGRFIPATMSRMTYKYERTLGDYLGIDHPDLKNITILDSDKEMAMTEWWEPEYAKARKSGNPKTILKFKAYWPIKPSDSFLVLKANDYNVEAAGEQKKRLKRRAEEGDGFIGTPVELYHNGEIITHKFSEKLPITQYPVKDQGTDAPIMVYEFPVEDPPWGLYIAGVDPYRHDQAEGSDSLGAIYIFKRMHSIASDKYQDMFVASYVARPGRMDDWNEQARMLIKWYNAVAFVENDEMSFIRYMENKGDDHYLSDVPQWLKDIVPFSTATQTRDKGVHSSPKTIKFYSSCLKNYLDELLGTTKNEKGETVEILGVSRVLDMMLLEEIIKFNKDGNFDRERAAAICLAAANKMIPLGKVNDNSPFDGMLKKPITGRKLFNTRPSSIFKRRQQKFYH